METTDPTTDKPLDTTGRSVSPNSASALASPVLIAPPVATPSPPAGEGIVGSSWIKTLGSSFSASEVELFMRALRYSGALYAAQHLPSGEPVLRHAQEISGILAALRVDIDTLAAGILALVPDYRDDYVEDIQTVFSPTVAHLVEGVARMRRIRAFGAGGVAHADRAAQAEALRKMLLAMAEDIRVVIIALADRLQTTRYIAVNGKDGKERFARETLDIFSPLANRLGLWQLKWELEDLSFRILEPERYKHIARL